MLSTQALGGVEVTQEQLSEMQAGDYVLHARGGKLRKVAVVKTRLPVDPLSHAHCLGLVQAPNGTIYAGQRTILSKSTDGGRTWEHFHNRDPKKPVFWFDAEGRMQSYGWPEGEKFPAIWTSEDEGETWERVGRLDMPTKGEFGLTGRIIPLRDGTLVAPVEDRTEEASKDWGTLISGTIAAYVCRSTDGGRAWPEHCFMCEWGVETCLTELPSGRLVAVMRYQRPPLPEDPPDLLERTGATVIGAKCPYKHVFLADSEDGGRTWTPPRQLTTVFGQCRGSGVGLSGDRFVVVHDHRYPRSLGSGRAMVSLDGSRTWEDEVYYLGHGMTAGYAESICLDGEEMLTLTGSCYGDVDHFVHSLGRSQFVLIRWKLVR